MGPPAFADSTLRHQAPVSGGFAIDLTGSIGGEQGEERGQIRLCLQDTMHIEEQIIDLEWF